MGDDGYKPITDLTFPRAKEYAEKIGAEFHVISSRRYPKVNICYEKFQMRDLLDRVDRIVYVDGDVLIRPTAENIFEKVPYGSFGAMNEAEHFGCWTPKAIADQFRPYGWTGPWNGKHFNAGVMIFDATHKRVFENPIITNQPYWDQPYFNVMVGRLGIPYHDLGTEFNFLVFHGYKEDVRKRAQFLHFCGWGLAPVMKAKEIQIEIDSWPKN